MLAGCVSARHTVRAGQRAAARKNLRRRRRQGPTDRMTTGPRPAALPPHRRENRVRQRCVRTGLADAANVPKSSPCVLSITSGSRTVARVGAERHESRPARHAALRSARVLLPPRTAIASRVCDHRFSAHAIALPPPGVLPTFSPSTHRAALVARARERAASRERDRIGNAGDRRRFVARVPRGASGCLRSRPSTARSRSRAARVVPRARDDLHRVRDAVTAVTAGCRRLSARHADHRASCGAG